ncbi:MAG: 4-phosphoerythronate dehydrogenase [Bacteroidales bacterium]|jgi:erythronate-4-phosphate dehydrogenase|nr:4-phosphoerythronate dehydrogenase [Bacteroidales bacterium]
MKIVIDEKIPFIRGVFERWADVVYSPGRHIDARMVKDADALIVRTRTRCNADLLKGSSVRIVASATIGFDHLDTGWLEENGIRWANAPGCNSGSVMQYITSLLFFLARKHNLDLQSVTLGIVGVGNVGSKVERAARALGMHVLLNDPPRERREFSPAPEFHPLHKLLTESDILSLHVPLTREGEDKTYHLLNQENLRQMKKSAILVNSSRGEVVDNIALREALDEGLLQGAALDVWEAEPAADPVLADLADIATPHIAGYSVDGKANATISSVRAVAKELHLPLTGWSPEALPQPEEPLIDLTMRTVIHHLPASTLELVEAAVRHTYPIEEDDLLFRKGKKNFEYLRDNYRIRREFGSYRIRTDDREAARIMSELGFEII